MVVLKFIAQFFIVCMVIIAVVFYASDNSAKSETTNNKTSSYFDVDKIFAVVDGRSFSIGDILGDDLYKADNDFYDVLSDKLAAKYISENWGTVDYQVTDEEALRIYEEYDLQNQGSYEQIEQRLKKYIRDSYIEKQLQDQFTAKIQDKSVVYKIKKTALLSEFINLEEAYAGNPNALIAVVEFSDLQCPVCKKAEPIIEQLIANKGSQVGFYFRHFPLSIHPEAELAGSALECAAEQQQLKAYKSIAFANQQSLFSADLLNYASQIDQIDQQQFNNCFDQQKYLYKVKQDLNIAKELNLRGTPTIFVGKLDKQTARFIGQEIVGYQQYEVYENIIDDLIANN